MAIIRGEKERKGPAWLLEMQRAINEREDEEERNKTKQGDTCELYETLSTRGASGSGGTEATWMQEVEKRMNDEENESLEAIRESEE